MDQWYIDNALNYYQSLIRKGLKVDNIKFNITCKDKHNEISWSKHIKDFFLFIE